MSTDTADESPSEERDILYELFIYSEWVQEPELVTKFGYGDDNLAGYARGGSGLRSWFAPTSSVCAPILWHRLSFAPWQLSLSADHRLCAILKHNDTVEIRSSGKEAFCSVVATCHLRPEAESQFRRLSWSPDSSLLAVGSPTGRVQMFDLSGGFLFSLENDDSLASLEGAAGGHALVDILWTRTENTRRTQWSYEVVLVAFNGRVRSYLINSESFSPSFTFDLPLYSGSSIGAVVYHAEYSLLFVGEGGRRLMDQANADDPSLVAGEAGIAAWKLLSGEPYLQKVNTIYQEPSGGGLFPWMMTLFRAGCEDAVVCLAVSPSGKQLVCLHSSSTVTLWSLPGLIVSRVWRSFELPAYQATNPYLPESESLIHQRTRGFFDIITVDWWNEQALVVVRRSGSICVVSLESGRNLLGENPEWFGLAPRLAAMSEQGFLTLECEWQMGLSKARANSSFIGSELESSLLQEDSADESPSAERPSWLRRVLAVGPLRKMLEYVTDIELADGVKPRRIVKIYRLLGVKSTTPQELFVVKINNGDYEEALSLASRYDLDPDPVFQHQWRLGEPTKANIDALLHRISNRNWVLNECLNQVPNDAVSCRELLLHGIRITNVFLVAGTPADEIPKEDATAEESLRKRILRDVLQPELLTHEQKWMLECRRKFLTYLDTLQIYESFTDSFSGKEFAWFREQSPLSAAIHFAREGRADHTLQLLTQHSEQLAHHWLAILTQFPETISPDNYAKLLPYASSKPPYSIRKWQPIRNRLESDWAEILVPCPFAESWASAEQQFYEENPDVVQWRCSPGKQPNFDMVAKWYKCRARSIESCTLLTENALVLVHLAQQKLHPKGDLKQQLMKLVDDLTTVKMMTFNCGLETVSLQDIEEKTPIEQLRLIMSNATDASYEVCFREWLLPFVERCDRSEPGSKLELLKVHLAEQAAEHLDRVTRVWSLFTKAHSSSSTMATDIDIADIAHQLEVCIACVEATRQQGQLPQCRHLISLLPSRSTILLEESTSTAATRLNALFDQVDQLTTKLEAAQFLAEYGTELTVAQMTEIGKDSEAVHDLLGKMFYRLAAKSPRVGLQEWLRVARNVHGVIQATLPTLNVDHCFELMCLALIGSMKRDNIHIAGRMLSLDTIQATKNEDDGHVSEFPYRLPPDASRRIVLRAARGYVDSATSYADPCIALAKSCLALLGETGDGDADKQHATAIEVRKELNLIQTLPLLSKLGVQMLPVHVRSHDKLSLIREALVCNKTNYKNYSKISLLAQYLGVYDELGSDAEGLILSMVAEVAQREGDLKVALEFCQRIEQGKHVSGWKACARLASCEDLTQFDARCDLIDFCVAYAPAQYLQKLIEQKGHIELQHHHDTVERKFTSKPESSLSSASPLTSLPLEAVDSTKQLVKQVIRADTWLSSVTQTVKGLTVGPANLAVNVDVDDEGDNATSKKDGDRRSSNDRDMVTTWSVPAFYSGVWGESALTSRLNADFNSLSHDAAGSAGGHGDDDCHATSISAGSRQPPQLATVLHFAAVADLIAGTKSAQAVNDDMMLSLAGEYLADDALLALAHLLQLSDVRRAEELFLEQLPYTRHCLRLGAYVFSLATISRENADGRPDVLDSFMRLSRDELVERVENMDTLSDEGESLRVLVKKFCQLEADLTRAELVQQRSGGTVDVGRFGHDEEYKRDTILGMALCEDLETLRVALNLAHHYDVPAFEVCAGHIEHLFQLAVHPDVIEARLQEEGIQDSLMQDKMALRHLLQQRIYPILNGKSYDHLKIYYRLLKSCVQRDADAKRIDAYMMLLETVDEKLDGVDFKGLISASTEEQRRSLLEIIDESNIDEVAKLCGRFKSLLRSISRSTVLQLYLKNEFVAAGQRPGTDIINLFKKHLKHIRYLTPDDVLDFIRGVCFDPLVATVNLDRSYRLDIIKSFLAFAKRMAKLNQPGEPAVGKLSSPQTTNAAGVVDQNTSAAAVANGWETLQAHLAGFVQHLQKIDDGFVDEILDFAQNPQLEAYVQRFEMTAGEKDKLEALLTDCALTECDPSLLESLLAICPASVINCSPIDIFLRAVQVAVQQLIIEASPASSKLATRNDASASDTDDADEVNVRSRALSRDQVVPMIFQTRKPTTVLRRLLKTGAKFSTDKVAFDRSVVELVQPFCLDTGVALSSRLEVLRLLKECSCAVRPEDEALRLHLETLALLEERWPGTEVGAEETETAEGRQAVFLRLLDASEVLEQFDTLASLLESWPPFDESVSSPWLLLLHRMSSVPSVLGATFISLVRKAQQQRNFAPDDFIRLEEAWAPRLTPSEHAQFLLESSDPTLHLKVLEIVEKLQPEDITVDISDRLLELNLVPRLVSGPHYVHLLDRLLQRDDFERIANSTVTDLSNARMLPEAGSLALLAGAMPASLQSFSGALSFLSRWRPSGSDAEQEDRSLSRT